MRAGDRFTIINHERTSFDAGTFSLLYLPVIGRDSYSVYGLLRVFNNGRLSHFLEYLEFSIHNLTDAFDKLSALGLLQIYDNHGEFFFEVKSPLSFELFLADDFYRQLLISKIGENKVSALQKSIEPMGQNISKKFHEVYKVNFEQSERKETVTFDMKAFELMMENHGLKFANETEDKLMIYSLSEKFDLDWFQLLSKAELVKNADNTLNLTALQHNLSNENQPKKALSEFPKGYQELIPILKSVKADEFLAQLYLEKGGNITSSDRKVLSNLTERKFAEEVKNALIYYVLIQEKNAALNQSLCEVIANDWQQNHVLTAEDAISRILERRQKIQENKTKKVNNKPAKLVKEQPKWSNASYVNTTSDDEKAKFAALQEKMRNE